MFLLRNNVNMKQRLISAGVGICILVIVLIFYKTILLNISIAAISFMAVYELLVATKYIRNKLLAGACLSFSILISFIKTSLIHRFLVPICIIFIFLLFIIMIVEYKIIHIEQIGFAFLISVVIPFTFSLIIYIRDNFVKIPHISIFYILLILGSAWISDTGAYFTGTFLGKTKFVPEISPKKTIEGVIGGIISSIVFGIILGLIFSVIFKFKINYFKLLFTMPIASMLGILGDLSASLIKRQCLIKDFGMIMPGHGGILDRFDSTLFTIPFYYLVIIFFPLIK